MRLGRRRTTDATGAKGTRTGSRDRWLTNSATCGRQKSGLTYQSPNAPVDTKSDELAPTGPVEELLGRPHHDHRSGLTAQPSPRGRPGTAESSGREPEGRLVRGRSAPCARQWARGAKAAASPACHRTSVTTSISRKAPSFKLGASDLRVRWWRGRDLNPRPSGYEPDELPDCSTPRRTLHRTSAGATAATREIPWAAVR